MKHLPGSKHILCLIVTVALGAVLSSCGEDSDDHLDVIALGFDGMDPRLCERLMDAGELPNLNKMRISGGYSTLGTSTPPQSPVAWSNFITGGDPGGHGVYDFIHRDPSKQCMPYYSAARTIDSDEGWEVGGCRIPLTFWPFNQEAPHTVLSRGGTPFWDYLDEAGVPVWVYDIPVNLTFLPAGVNSYEDLAPNAYQSEALLFRVQLGRVEKGKGDEGLIIETWEAVKRIK